MNYHPATLSIYLSIAIITNVAHTVADMLIELVTVCNCM